MSSAAERKKAREAYLAALSQQRDNDTDNGGKGGGDAASQEKNVHGENSRSVAMSKREKMFEERRKQFYEKNQEPVVAQDQGRGEGAIGGQVPGGGPVQVTLGGGSLEIQRRKQETHDISHEAGRVGNSSADRYPETDPEVRNQSTALGFGGRSEVDDQAIKREKQVEYARQLESQISPPPPHQTKSQQHHQHQQGRGDPSPFAGSEVDDKALKRAKQAEYASQLDLQINPPLQQQRQSHHHQQHPRGGYEFGGSEVDDKALKREKQAEYAKQLESQINPPPHHNHHQEQQGGRGGREGGYGDSNFGGPEVDDKAAKRAKQAEYARQLESQIKPPSHHHHHHQDQQHQQSHQQQQGGGTRYDSIPFGGSESDDKAAKRAKQAEYARQLESQMNPYQQPQQQLQPLHQQRDHNRQQQQGRGGGPFGGSEVDDKAVKRAKQAEYARQLESQMNPPPHQQQHQHQQGGGGGGGGRGYDPHPFGGSETDDKATKRAKQAEYARQLESQMNSYQQPQQGGGGGYGGANHRAHQEDSSSASSAISEGWEMGPLGVPVRKTLAVGNRGVQKAYLQNHSPQKPFFPGAPAAAMGAMGAGYSRGEQLHEDYNHPHHHQHLHQQQQQPQAHLQQGDPLPLSHLAPASALGIMGQDEREARKIQLQVSSPLPVCHLTLCR
jgi:non-canonical (house-cleaning) NTP pyrophosphatase